MKRTNGILLVLSVSGCEDPYGKVGGAENDSEFIAWGVVIPQDREEFT
jgi:hypothetical protein